MTSDKVKRQKRTVKEKDIKRNEQNFLAKAKSIHGDKYDYSNVSYINSQTKVEIICKKHNKSFFVIPNNHTNKKSGCPYCCGGIRLTIEDFIKQVIPIYGNRFDYSKAIYINMDTKIEIICKKHNITFWQMPDNHIYQGVACCGCHKENIDIRSKNNTLTLEIFIEKAKSIHEDKYDYSKSIYLGNEKEIEIICKKHKKSFWQKPKHHIYSKSGCQTCGNEIISDKKTYTEKEFIDKANVIHNNKYDYSKIKYIGYYIKIEIVCLLHGSFWQKPTNHINQKNGCPQCGIGNISAIETDWLDSKRISKKNRNQVLVINGKKYNVDACIQRSKTIYEFYGDYWHGNINLPRFASDKMNERNNKTFGELYARTIERETELKAAGYKIVSIWESDWNAKQKSKKKSRNT
jgi:G:T-mismatch repair DNA endonuclease (very short patch repair protein)